MAATRSPVQTNVQPPKLGISPRSVFWSNVYWFPRYHLLTDTIPDVLLQPMEEEPAIINIKVTQEEEGWDRDGPARRDVGKLRGADAI